MSIAAATVHFPYMTAWPDKARPIDKLTTDTGFQKIRDSFLHAKVETLIVVSSEHIVNLEPRMAPPFLIGTGSVHQTFPEPQFNLKEINYNGNPDLALSLVKTLYQEGFDPAHSSELRLDHGTTLPLQKLNVTTEFRVIPIIINTLFEPLPSLKRCVSFGEALGQFLENQLTDQKIGLLATGGLSHAVGTPGMDTNNPTFDKNFIQALLNQRLIDACVYDDETLNNIGNGTHEIRNWLVVAAAQKMKKPTLITEIPFAEGWNSGVYQMLWE